MPNKKKKKPIKKPKSKQARRGAVRQKKKFLKPGRKKLLAGLIVAVVALIIGGWLIAKEIPNPKKLSSGEYPESSQIFDRNGKLLYEFYSDKRRIPVELNNIPDNLVKATMAIEDTNFYRHFGFDIKGIARGFYRTVFKKRLQGGSTLTQQLVKNALLTPERTVSRKIKEAILTVATEILYTKDQILQMYLNQTPYGGTMWGVQAAAKGIFNKDVKDLDLAESALIAGLPGSPTTFSPFAHPDAAKKRQELVLYRMQELGMISEEERKAAEKEKLDYYVQRSGIEAPHFVFYVKEGLVEEYGLSQVNEGGLKITTTLDLDVQKMAEEVVAEEISGLERYKVSNGAVVVTEPKTGEILAMVGSKDYFADDIDGKFNVTTALRQPGSSIKPLNYAIGLDRGIVTPASIFIDEVSCFQVPGQDPYCPTNYGYRYFGVQTLRNSLANSLNIPAVKMLQMNGVEAFVASASAMGIDTFQSPENYGLSLTLGGGEVRMTDMAEAFGALANMGIRQDLVSILKIEDKYGEVLEEYRYVPGERVLSAETAFMVHSILSDDGARSAVFGRGSLLNIKKHPEVAVKTGTTNELRDNWTIGYTQDYVVVVWVGNNDNTKMSWIASGVTGASPIWNEIMTNLLEDKTVKKPTRPSGVISLRVCNQNGALESENPGCESHFEYFNKNFLPKGQPIAKMAILVDKNTGVMIKEGEVNENAEWQEKTVLTDVSGNKLCLDCPRNNNEDNQDSQ